MKNFSNKVAVITGAASGIGRGLAEKCVQEGMRVVLADIDIEGLENTANEVSSNSSKPLVVPTDVSKERQIEALAQKTLEKFGAVHLLFNNAGVEVRGKLWEQTRLDWEWIINVNLWSVIHGIRIFVPIMLAQKTACHIINTASGGAMIAGPTLGSYRATKSAIFSISETLHHELKQENAPIGVSVLYPAFVQSNLLNAERNRPVAYVNQKGATPVSAYEREMVQTFQKNNEEAISALTFADKVFEGIRNDVLYLQTHPEINPMIQERMNHILNQK